MPTFRQVRPSVGEERRKDAKVVELLLVGRTGSTIAGWYGLRAERLQNRFQPGE
jgi:hypothetical protein